MYMCLMTVIYTNCLYYTMPCYRRTMMKGSHASHVHDVALDLPLDMSAPGSHDHDHHHHGDDKVKLGSGVSSWIR